MEQNQTMVQDIAQGAAPGTQPDVRNLNPMPQGGAYMPAVDRARAGEQSEKRGKTIVILLICILVVNALALVLQIYNPFTASRGTFTGSPANMPGFSQGDGPVTFPGSGSTGDGSGE